MFKKLAMAVGVICLMGMLTACGRTSEQKVTEIRVAFNQNENHPQYRAMKAFGEKFEKETNGRYHVTIYPNGVLGEQGEWLNLSVQERCRWQLCHVPFRKDMTLTLRS